MSIFFFISELMPKNDKKVLPPYIMALKLPDIETVIDIFAIY